MADRHENDAEIWQNRCLICFIIQPNFITIMKKKGLLGIIIAGVIILTMEVGDPYFTPWFNEVTRNAYQWLTENGYSVDWSHFNFTVGFLFSLAVVVGVIGIAWAVEHGKEFWDRLFSRLPEETPEEEYN